MLLRLALNSRSSCLSHPSAKCWDYRRAPPWLAPTAFIEEIIFSPLCFLGVLAKNYLTFNVSGLSVLFHWQIYLFSYRVTNRL
jgi:hypothetical protein